MYKVLHNGRSVGPFSKEISQKIGQHIARATRSLLDLSLSLPRKYYKESFTVKKLCFGQLNERVFDISYQESSM